MNFSKEFLDTIDYFECIEEFRNYKIIFYHKEKKKKGFFTKPKKKKTAIKYAFNEIQLDNNRSQTTVCKEYLEDKKRLRNYFNNKHIFNRFVYPNKQNIIYKKV